MTEETVSDLVAQRVRSARKDRGWTASDLATRCMELGAEDLTENVIENIESGRRREGIRRRDITIDELLVLARALDVAPIHLIVGIFGEHPVPITGKLSVSSPVARNWIRGYAPLTGADKNLFRYYRPAAERNNVTLMAPLGDALARQNEAIAKLVAEVQEMSQIVMQAQQEAHDSEIRAQQAAKEHASAVREAEREVIRESERQVARRQKAREVQLELARREKDAAKRANYENMRRREGGA
jgi:transcriptional regulator with XRE-family HTH domain